MATVIYQPSMAPEMGVLLKLYDMIQNRRMATAYKEDVTNLLSERKEGRKGEEILKPFQMKTPTGWGYQDPGFVISPTGEKTTLKEGIAPTGFETQETMIPSGERRPLSDMEKRAYDIQTRRMLDSLGAGVLPQYRADTRAYTMFPEQPLEEKVRTKQRYAVTGLKTWRGYDKRTGEPLKGVVRRSRHKPGDTKNIVWDTELSTERYYGGKAGREYKQITGEINLQKLLSNYLDDPSRENEVALKNAYKAKGYTLVKPETSIGDKVKRFFGYRDAPYIMPIDKQGNYIKIDETGKEIKVNPKKKKSSLGEKYGY